MRLRQLPKNKYNKYSVYIKSRFYMKFVLIYGDGDDGAIKTAIVE